MDNYDQFVIYHLIKNEKTALTLDELQNAVSFRTNSTKTRKNKKNHSFIPYSYIFTYLKILEKKYESL